MLALSSQGSRGQAVTAEMSCSSVQPSARRARIFFRLGSVKTHRDRDFSGKVPTQAWKIRWSSSAFLLSVAVTETEPRITTPDTLSVENSQNSPTAGYRSRKSRIKPLPWIFWSCFAAAFACFGPPPA